VQARPAAESSMLAPPCLPPEFFESALAVMDAERTDEAQAQAAAEKVMALENKIKVSHLTMLVRIKNTLTAQQQAKLRAVRGR
jgi:hypothetical protein